MSKRKKKKTHPRQKLFFLFPLSLIHPTSTPKTGEPIASERFTVGGHEWVLLFYPDGKRSSSAPPPPALELGAAAAGHGQQGVQQQQQAAAAAQAAAVAAAANAVHQRRNAEAAAAAAVAVAAGRAALQAPRAASNNAAATTTATPSAPAPAAGSNATAAVAALNAAQRQQSAQQQQQLQARNAAANAANAAAAAQQAASAAAATAAAAQAQAQQAQAAAAAAAAGSNEYAALFVALIGETSDPLGVVNTSDGRVVRAFHRFTLVDQHAAAAERAAVTAAGSSAPGTVANVVPTANHLTKGRRRDQGAVKISCARQDPNARNCHGYRKFVKRSVLENPAAGYLVDDTIVIRYTIELVVSSGGALAKPGGSAAAAAGGLGVGSLRGLGGRGGGRFGSDGAGGALPPPPPPSLGVDLARLLDSGAGADVEFEVEGDLFKAHRVVLSARSPVFDALLNGSMREARQVLQIGEAGATAPGGGGDVERSSPPASRSVGGASYSSLPRIRISDVRSPVFRALLHFAYTDELPSEIGSGTSASGGGGGAAGGGGEGSTAAAAAPLSSTALVPFAPAPPNPTATTTTAAFAAALSTVGAALDVPMAQHLLVAADRFALSRLRRICERRLCEGVDVAMAATTLALAEQNNAGELKSVCLAFVSRNLQAVMASEGYRHMVRSRVSSFFPFFLAFFPFFSFVFFFGKEMKGEKTQHFFLLFFFFLSNEKK